MLSQRAEMQENMRARLRESCVRLAHVFSYISVCVGAFVCPNVATSCPTLHRINIDIHLHCNDVPSSGPPDYIYRMRKSLNERHNNYRASILFLVLRTYWLSRVLSGNDDDSPTAFDL